MNPAIHVIRHVTVTVAFLALSCSGGDTTPLADYQDQVNALCAPALDAMNGTVEPAIEQNLARMGTEPFDAPELQGFYRALIDPTDQAGALIDDILDTLRDLDPPDQHPDDYAQLWDDIGATMQRARADIAAAAADPDAARELWDIDTSPFTPVDARAEDVGVPECTFDT